MDKRRHEADPKIKRLTIFPMQMNLIRDIRGICPMKLQAEDQGCTVIKEAQASSCCLLELLDLGREREREGQESFSFC